MVAYVSPFAACLTPPPPQPQPQPPKVGGVFARTVVELVDASAQDILLKGSFKVSDPDDGKVSIKVSAKPVAKYSGGALPADIVKAYGDGPTDLDLSALTGSGALKLSKASLKAAGTIGWTFDPKALSLDFLRAGETLTLTWKLTVSDGHSAVKKDIVVKVLGTNDAATIAYTPGPPLQKTAFNAPFGVHEGDARLVVQDLDRGEGTFRFVDPSSLKQTFGAFEFKTVPDPLSLGTVANVHYGLDQGSLALEQLESDQVAHESLQFVSFDGTAARLATFDIFGM